MDKDLAALIESGRPRSLGAYHVEPWPRLIRETLEQIAAAGKRTTYKVIRAWVHRCGEEEGHEPPTVSEQTFRDYLRDREGALWAKVKTR